VGQGQQDAAVRADEAEVDPEFSLERVGEHLEGVVHGLLPGWSSDESMDARRTAKFEPPGPAAGAVPTNCRGWPDPGRSWQVDSAGPGLEPADWRGFHCRRRA